MAQSGAPDATFTTGSSIGGNVSTILTQADEKSIVSGAFSYVQGVERRGLARLNADGSLDAGFNPGPTFPWNFAGSQLAKFSDGSILVALPHTDVAQGNRVINKLYRYSASGAAIPAFASLPGANGYTYGFSVLSNDNILIWGDFSQVQGYARRGLARLDAYGYLSGGFVPQIPADSSIVFARGLADGTVYAVIVKSSGESKLLKLSSQGAVMLEKSITLAGTSIDDYPFISELVVQSDGKILITGRFHRINDIVRNSVVRLNTDGSVDTHFNIDFLKPATAIQAMHLQTSGKIVLAGKITHGSDNITAPVIRLLSDGSLDPSFDVLAEGDADYPQLTGYALAEQPDGKLLASLVYGEPSAGGGSSGAVLIGNPGSYTPPSTPTTPASRMVRLLSEGSYRPHRPTTLKVDSRAAHLTRISWNDVTDETGYDIERLVNDSWVSLASVPANTTFFDDQTGDGVTNYSYRVRSKNAIGASEFTPGKDVSLPTALSAVTAVPSGYQNAVVSWTDVSGEWQYEIYRKSGSSGTGLLTGTRPPVLYPDLSGSPLIGYPIGFPPPVEMVLIGTVPAGTTTYTDTTVSPHETYTYQVLARNIAGTVVSPGKIVTMPSDQIPLKADRLTAAPTAGQAILLSWRNVDWETGYLLERSVDGINNWQTIATLGPDQNTYLDAQGFPPGLTFSYRVRSFNDQGSAAPSTVESAVVPSPAWTPAGSLDASFAPASISGSPYLLKSSPAGYLYLVGSTSLERYSADGQKSFFGSVSNDFTSISDVLVRPDESLWVTGSPWSIYYPKRIVVLKADGVVDDSYSFPQFDNSIRRLFTLRNGKVLALGSFSTVDGLPSTGIARLNPTGSADTSFAMSGLPLDMGDPSHFLEQSDGKLIIVMNNQSIIRLLASGERDLSFGFAGVVRANSTHISTVALHVDDSILVGGNFTDLHDGNLQTNRGILARLTRDGRIDETFDLGQGFPATVTREWPNGTTITPQNIQHISVDAQQRILIAGNILEYDSLAIRKVIRLLPNGRIDNSFQFASLAEDPSFLMIGHDDTFYMWLGSGLGLKRFFSKPVLASTMAPPPVGNPVSDSTLALSWQAEGAASFDIEKWDTTTSSWVRLVSGYALTSYTVTGLAPGSGTHYRIRRNFAEKDSTYSPSLEVRAYTSFENWKKTKGLTPLDPSAQDTDGDGAPALLEYALDLDPTKPDANGGTSTNYTADQISLTYRKKRSELSYIVETSADFKTWTANGIVETPGPEAGEVTATSPSNPSTKKFIRLRVVEN